MSLSHLGILLSDLEMTKLEMNLMHLAGSSQALEVLKGTYGVLMS